MRRERERASERNIERGRVPQLAGRRPSEFIEEKARERERQSARGRDIGERKRQRERDTPSGLKGERKREG